MNDTFFFVVRSSYYYTIYTSKWKKREASCRKISNVEQMYQCFIIQVKLYIINNNDNNSKSILHSWKDDKYLSSDYFIIPPLLRPTVIDLRLKISYQNITTIEKKKYTLSFSETSKQARSKYQWNASFSGIRNTSLTHTKYLCEQIR